MAKERCLFDVLLEPLDEMDDDVFQRFKLFLTDPTLVREYEVIKKDKLRTDDKSKILEAMMDSYGIFTINVIKRVLLELHQQLVYQRLCTYPYNPQDIIAACREELRSNLTKRFQFLVESLSNEGHKMPFQEGYTELFITEADTGQVHQMHDVQQMERFPKPSVQETPIQCQDLFKGTTETRDRVRMVLTKGVAGVGKTILTQKFSLDWAGGSAHHDVQLLFHFTFRELNVLRDSEYSLVELLHYLFQNSKALHGFQHIQVLFILDGLDECRLPLEFSETRVLTEPTESASVEELLVNLIRGDLLPSARLWITTRPAAANQIPARFVSMMTEVRGFTNSQKEQYFRKRFSDGRQAAAVISHIKSIRSLYILSSIPIFCWILSTVFKTILDTEEADLPNTLTEMYVHFLVVQAKIKNIKYEGRDEMDFHWTPDNKKMVKCLGKLAFEQLLRGRLIFYVSDLSECGLDAEEVACYSGVFTQVFREERGLYKDKVYCFVHLSVQEFLAALHVHQTFFISKVNLLSSYFSDGPGPEENMPSISQPPASPEDFYCSAVDLALESPNGHLDLFLRFLLGLSLPTNQCLLPGLLPQTRRTDQKIVKYIKEKLNRDRVSTERSLNLFHCLNELNDRSLLEQIQKFMKRGQLSDQNMSAADWSALSFLLLSSELKEFDLRKYCPTERALLKLLPVVRASTKAILSVCGLSSQSCPPLSSILISSGLTHLDLSNNNLQDSGVEQLCEGLKSATCRLQTLRLTTCELSDSACAPLSSVLISSSLTHLDLSNNNLQDSGVEQLCEGLKSATCRLQTLGLSGCLVSEGGGASLASAIGSAASPVNSTHSDQSSTHSDQSSTHSDQSSTPSVQSSTSFHLKELDLGFNHLGASRELLLSLQAPHGPLQVLRLDPAGERFMVPGPRKYSCQISLDPNTAHSRLKPSGDTVELLETTFFPFLAPDHTDKFTESLQVLSCSELRGRCYWEVQWRGDEVEIAVSYKGISRFGDGSRFGDNSKSWSMRIEKGQYTFLHNRIRTSNCSSAAVMLQNSLLPFFSPSGKVGVFLDCEAGALSFYEVASDGELVHFHTFCCSFSEPLMAGFGVWWPGSSVRINVK